MVTLVLVLVPSAWAWRPRRVGQVGGKPSAIHAAATRGGEDGVGPVDRPPVVGVQDHLDRRHVASGQDPEGSDGEIERCPVGVDGDALGPDQTERLVHGSERVGAQRHRTSTSPAQTSTGRASACPPAHGDGGPPTAGHAHVGRPVPVVRRPWRRRVPAAGRAGRPAPRPRPAPRSSGPTGGPTMSTSSMTTQGATACTRSRSATEVGRPGVCDRSAPRPSRRDAVRGRGVAAWARSAPRPRGSRARGRRAAARRPRALGPRRRPGCAACRRRHRRWPAGSPVRRRAGTSWRRARRTPAPPRSSAASAPTPRRAAATGWTSGTVLLRPCTFAEPGGPPAGRRRRGRGGTQLHQRTGGSGVVGEAPAAQHDVGARALEGRSLRVGPATTPAAGRPAGGACVGCRGRRPVEPERDAAGLDDGLPPGAAAQVGQQGRLDGLAASGPVRRSRARPIGAGCPACRTRTGWPRRRRRRRPSGP